LRQQTVPLDHFQNLYAARPDPWRLATSPYERAKYAATLEALPRGRYRAALEIGCANGVFTERLADRCDDLLAIEPVSAALAEARRRNAQRGSVRFAQMFVPAEWPAGSFDLIAVSEVIDYLGKDDVDRLAERTCGSLIPGGDAILVHWVGKKRPGEAHGEEATDRFIAAAGGQLEVLRAARNRDYRLDVLRRL
jgi:cyclopropane fatty-acyl-phospholipid synthase-like methyltransferase